MSDERNFAFDLSVDGVSDHYLSMQELMAQYTHYKKQKNWEKAKVVLEYAVRCGYLPAEIELAHLYKTTPEFQIPHAERYHTAERIYLRLLNLPDLSDQMTAAVALGLADLYGNYTRRPIGCLGLLLHTKRLGFTVPERLLEDCHRQITQMDVNNFGKKPKDSLMLAEELLQIGAADRLVELLLRECVETDNVSLRGIAALSLADFYNERSEECDAYRKEAANYYRMACQNGFPEYWHIK